MNHTELTNVVTSGTAQDVADALAEVAQSNDKVKSQWVPQLLRRLAEIVAALP